MKNFDLFEKKAWMVLKRMTLFFSGFKINTKFKKQVHENYADHYPIEWVHFTLAVGFSQTKKRKGSIFEIPC